MSVIKSKMGTIKSKIGRKFEQKRKAKWVKEKANLVKAYESLKLLTHSTLSAKYTLHAVVHVRVKVLINCSIIPRIVH